MKQDAPLSAQSKSNAVRKGVCAGGKRALPDRRCHAFETHQTNGGVFKHLLKAYRGYLAGGRQWKRWC